MYMRLGTWNVRSVYRAGSLVSVSKELSKYKSDLVGVQEVRWGGSSTAPARGYTFLYGKGNENSDLDTGFFCITESYQQLRGLGLLMIGCHITVLNVYAPKEDKLMLWRTAFMRNYSVNSIKSLNTT
jgi:exonuclease III